MLEVVLNHFVAPEGVLDHVVERLPFLYLHRPLCHLPPPRLLGYFNAGTGFPVLISPRWECNVFYSVFDTRLDNSCGY